MEDNTQTTWEKYPAALPKGSILAGQYVIQDVLGQGGFGITYLAEDHKLKIKVAIKEYFPESMVMRQGTVPQVTVYSGGRMENFQYGMQCFLDEARVLAQFQGNPNIVGVRSYFEENDTAYFVMDYIEGINFKTYMREHGGKLSWEETCRIMLPVMDALAEVHGKGIIHRDVTPDNILITDDHTVKLLDFGAARYSIGDRSQSLDVVLKAGYAPKEQYTRRGKQGPYTDVYSVAACFYAALCGYLPPESLDRMDKDEIISLRARGVQLPEGVEEAVLKGLEVRAEDRFQSMGEFKNAILHTNASGREWKAGAKSILAPNKNEGGRTMDHDIKSSGQSGGQKEAASKGRKGFHVKLAVGAAVAVIGCFLAVWAGNMRTQEEMPAVGKKTASNILMEEEERDLTEELENLEGVLGNHGLRPASIRKVTFLNTQKDVPENAWDVSDRRDGSVMAWTTERDGGGFDLSIAAEGNIIMKSGKFLFFGYKNLEEIDFNQCFDTGQAVSMRWMFCNCEALQTLNVNEFDTGSAVDMCAMFQNCSMLENLDVSGFDTSQATDISWMFAGCRSLQEVDVSGFDTSQVTDMKCMFMDCNQLQTVDVRRFDTSLVTDMGWMFAGCSILKELDVISFNTSRVTNMCSMFTNCGLLQKLDVRSFDTSRVTNMNRMFMGCKLLEELDVSGFDTGQVTDMSWMFGGCSLLKNLDVDDFDTSQVTDMSYMFEGCDSLSRPYAGWYN